MEESTPRASGSRRNVLFIAVDDLRPLLSCYGCPGMHTPNMDRLASRGMLFDHAYCQQAICSPSRTSLMTGRRPDSTRVHDLLVHFRETIPDVTTLPQAFQAAGYEAQAIGKIYHGKLDDPPSWSVPSWRGAPQRATAYLSPEKIKSYRDRNASLSARPGELVQGATWDTAPAEDTEFPDGLSAEEAVRRLRDFASSDRPFFLAVGFIKPHLPLVVPQKYFDLYPLEKIELPSTTFPAEAPASAPNEWEELNQYEGAPPHGPVPRTLAREMIRGYRASISYLDAQLGKVLDALEETGLEENTYVAFWSDHGFHLGEKGLWCKHTNFEDATRVTLILAGPEIPPGKIYRHPVELLDLYPTLCDLCAVAPPEGLEGVSLRPIFQHPDAPILEAAQSQYPRDLGTENEIMGRSIRTQRHRYTRWTDRADALRGEELYDYDLDPGETINFANAAGHQEIRQDLCDLFTRLWNH